MLQKAKTNYKRIGAPPQLLGNSAFQEIDILLKLLPYFDVSLIEKSKVNPDAKELRRLLGITISEADMIK
jgi:hypothetical protein